MPLFGSRNHRRMALGLLVGSALSACLPAQAGAHGGSRVFPIPELTDEMLAGVELHDGSVEEWYDLVGEPTMSLVDFRRDFDHGLPDPSDLDFRIWLAWHDEPDRLYVAFAASDDVHTIPQRRSGFPTELTLAIDADHSGGGLNLESWETKGFWGESQQYGAIARTAGGRTALYAYFTSGLGRGYSIETKEDSWIFYPPYADAGGGVAGENPIIRVIELYVTPYDSWQGPDSRPEDVAVSDLTAGKVIGFAILVWEKDDEGRFSLGPEAIPTEDPELDILYLYRAELYLDGLLLPANAAGAEPEGSAVESVSWGRIKASLEFE